MVPSRTPRRAQGQCRQGEPAACAAVTVSRVDSATIQAAATRTSGLRARRRARHGSGARRARHDRQAEGVTAAPSDRARAVATATAARDGPAPTPPPPSPPRRRRRRPTTAAEPPSRPAPHRPQGAGGDDHRGARQERPDRYPTILRRRCRCRTRCPGAGLRQLERPRAGHHVPVRRGDPVVDGVGAGRASGRTAMLTTAPCTCGSPATTDSRPARPPSSRRRRLQLLVERGTDPGGSRCQRGIFDGIGGDSGGVRRSYRSTREVISAARTIVTARRTADLTPAAVPGRADAERRDQQCTAGQPRATLSGLGCAHCRVRGRCRGGCGWRGGGLGGSGRDAHVLGRCVLGSRLTASR